MENENGRKRGGWVGLEVLRGLGVGPLDRCKGGAVECFAAACFHYKNHCL